MRTEDLIKVKNQLRLAIIKTFENAGIDPYAGFLILDALIGEFYKNSFENLIGADLVLKEQDEELSSS